ARWRPRATAAALIRELRTSANHIALRQAYVPTGRCTAPLSVFLATSASHGAASGDNADVEGWSALTCARPLVIDVPASHGAILTKPHVSVIASAILKQCRLGT